MASQAEAENAASVAYLTSLLEKNLRILVTDERMFTGQFKCTDKDCNVILGNAHEYRHPLASQVQAAANTALEQGQAKISLDMPSRYVGLIVIPGHAIRKIEVEEFDSSALRR